MLSYNLSGPHTLFEGDTEITCRTLRSLIELVLSWPEERFARVRIERERAHDLLPEHILIIAKNHDIGIPKNSEPERLPHRALS